MALIDLHWTVSWSLPGFETRLVAGDAKLDHRSPSLCLTTKMLKYLAFLDGAAFRLDPEDDRLEVAFRESGVGREVGIRRRREGEHDVQSSVVVSLLVL